MDENLWHEVDNYIDDTLVKEDDVLLATSRSTTEHGLPPIAVAPNQGKLLHLLATMIGARNILEVGTLAGYSAIWMGRALPPNGKLVTLEVDPKHAEVAQANIDRAGLSKVVEIRLGSALDTLPKLAEEIGERFDLVFIDADKQSTPEYVSWALDLTHPGSLIVIDNVVRNGAVADAATDDPGVKGIRRANEILASDERVKATAIQTVGLKGYDGFALALVTSS